MTLSTDKLEWFGYPTVKKVRGYDMTSRFDRIHERDRQRDGQILHVV